MSIAPADGHFEEPHVDTAQQHVVEDELDARARIQSSTHPAVSAITLDRFLKMEIPPRSTMLTPWLPLQGLAMIYAPRGTGKDPSGPRRLPCDRNRALAFCGGERLRPKRVLLLDGEMPAAVLQEMLRATVQASQSALADPTYFKIAAADLVRDGLPDLSSAAGQAFYRDVIADADVVVIDNLSTICRSLKENDADGWMPVQSWALALRRAGQVRSFHSPRREGRCAARNLPQGRRPRYRNFVAPATGLLGRTGSPVRSPL